MDHPFITRRESLSRALSGCDLCHDILMILNMNKQNRDFLMQRQECSITDKKLQAILLKRATRLGLLIKDLNTIASWLQIGQQCTLRDEETWLQFLLTNSKTDQNFETSIQKFHTQFDTIRKELQPMEHEDASSSYSDYTDKDTDSDETDDDETNRSSDIPS